MPDARHFRSKYIYSFLLHLAAEQNGQTEQAGSLVARCRSFGPRRRPPSGRFAMDGDFVAPRRWRRRTIRLARAFDRRIGARSCQAPGTREVLRGNLQTRSVRRSSAAGIGSSSCRRTERACRPLLRRFWPCLAQAIWSGLPARLSPMQCDEQRTPRHRTPSPWEGVRWGGVLLPEPGAQRTLRGGARAESPPARPGGRTGRAPPACPALAVGRAGRLRPAPPWRCDGPLMEPSHG